MWEKERRDEKYSSAARDNVGVKLSRQDGSSRPFDARHAYCRDSFRVNALMSDKRSIQRIT